MRSKLHLCRSAIDKESAPRKDEPGALVEMVKRNCFNHRTIIVLDRGYECYNVMAHLMNTPNVYFVLRVKHNHSAMREIERLPMLAERRLLVRFGW